MFHGRVANFDGKAEDLALVAWKWNPGLVGCSETSCSSRKTGLGPRRVQTG